ncbi:MAG: DUF3040 domain-containing protein [Propionibacteriales bacterium]|nr:DUF3040 domain-containing protein [Propionibacteriales bacterium]
MPLSEEEQRLLAELEQALAAEDPKFASALRGSSMRSRQRRIAIAAGGAFLLGIALLMTGVILPVTVVSVVGFVMMLASAYIALTAWRKSNQPEPLRLVGSDPQAQPVSSRGRDRSRSRERASRSASSSSFMERMEERWRRRRQSGF